MKKIAAALFLIVILFASAALSEAPASYGASENSRLVGLLITREDLSASAGEDGVIWASCTQNGPDADIRI